VDPFLPYLAGFFDGEGSIGIYRNGNPHGGRTLRVQLTQNVSAASTLLLKECQTRWGGSLCEMNRNHKRTAWNWQASATSGVKALSDIRPWPRLKAAEADIALEWWGQRPLPRRGSAGRYLPFSAAEHDFDVAAEGRLKAAKAGASATRVIGLSSTRSGADQLQLGGSNEVDACGE
jgi:hypothetical protein